MVGLVRGRAVHCRNLDKNIQSPFCFILFTPFLPVSLYHCSLSLSRSLLLSQRLTATISRSSKNDRSMVTTIFSLPTLSRTPSSN